MRSEYTRLSIEPQASQRLSRPIQAILPCPMQKGCILDLDTPPLLLTSEGWWDQYSRAFPPADRPTLGGMWASPVQTTGEEDELSIHCVRVDDPAVHVLR